MPLRVESGAPTLVIRKAPYEKSGLTRAALDQRLELTDDEFRVEGDLIVLGPLYADADRIPEIIGELEAAGLTYYDDFFELSGNWPDWLAISASVMRG